STLKVITNQIKKFGGTVEKYIGDAVCAVFGRQETHEDDHTRAVASAISILERLEDVNAILSTKGIALHVRIGINSGLVVTGQIAEFETVTGEAINVAQRLEAAAEQDSIFVSETVFRECKKAFECEKLQPITVKNKTEPVQPYKVVKKLPEKLHKEYKGWFVGRKSEFSEIEKAFQNAKKGNLTFVSIAGEAGIGKTRFAEEAISKLAAKNKTLVLHAHAASFGTEPYHIFEDLIGDYYLQSRKTIEDVYLKDISHQILTEDEKKRLESMEPKSRQLETQLAIKKFILDSKAAVVFIDNLQWLSPSSHETLKWLEENLEASLPLIFIFSYRPPFNLGMKKCSDILLPPLSEKEIREMMDEGDLNLSPADKANAVSRAGGNPFYLVEMMDAFRAGSGLPQSVKSLIMCRFDRLPKNHRFLMQVAASAGGKFSVKMASNIVERLKYNYNIDVLIKELVEKGFFQSSGENYNFTQAMVEDVVYGTILNVNKATLHRLIAEWATHSGKEISSSYLAEQWLRAGDIAKATEYFIDAGMSAKQKYANHEAIICLEKAKELLADKPEDIRTKRIYCNLALLYDFAGDIKRYDGIISEGLKHISSGEFYYHLKLHEINSLKNRGEVRRAAEEYGKILSEPDIVNYSQILLNAYLARWQTALMLSEDKPEYMQQAIALAESINNPALKLEAEQTVFNHYKNKNDLKEAEKHLNKIVSIQYKMDLFSKHLADLFWASFYWDKQDNFEEISKRADVSRKYFEEVGWQKGAGMSVFYETLALWRLNKLNEAQKFLLLYIDKTLDAYTKIRLQLALAAVLLAAGKRKEYKELKAAVMEALGQKVDAEIERQLAVFEGMHASDAEVPEVANALSRFEKMGSSGLDWEEYQMTLAGLLIRQGKYEEAKKRLENVYPIIKYNEKRWFLEQHAALMSQIKASFDKGR
ncbi:MAG: AAA family ATPase, partial [Deltaproteobacteria bacterium]|nr:AAA family ATPase [Deltaproteobacteria bacterium]